MTTDSTDTSPESRRSWSQLVREASSEEVPEEIDIRVPLRAQLEATSGTITEELGGTMILWDDLLALSRLRGLRFSLVGAAGISTLLLFVGAEALREIEELVYFNRPFQLPF